MTSRLAFKRPCTLLHQPPLRTLFSHSRPRIINSHPHRHTRGLASVIDNFEHHPTHNIPLPEQPILRIPPTHLENVSTVSTSSRTSTPAAKRIFKPTDAATPNTIFHVNLNATSPPGYRFIKKDDPECLLIFTAGYELHNTDGTRRTSREPANAEKRQATNAGYGIVYAPYAWTPPVSMRLESSTVKPSSTASSYSYSSIADKESKPAEKPPSSASPTPSSTPTTTISKTTPSPLIPSPQTTNRANLRAVLLSLTLRPWATEGFHRIILATSSKHITSGIQNCSTLRENRWRDWRDVEVEDRDLWEAVDGAVRERESEGVDVRFWLLEAGGAGDGEQENVALQWARLGAKKKMNPGSVLDRYEAKENWTGELRMWGTRIGR